MLTFTYMPLRGPDLCHGSDHASASADRAAQELEEGIATLSADLKRARKDLEASRADSLALVERLKYVQGYQSAAGKARKGARLPRRPCSGICSSCRGVHA